MLKFISAVIAAAAFAGMLTLLSATSTRLDARPARDAAPQSTPVTQTAPALAAAAISPALVRLDEVVRDLAVMRNSVEQLAAKQEQMAQTIATHQAIEQQAAEQDIIQTRSSPPPAGPVSPPPRKKARRPPKLAAQSSSVPPPAFRPE
ncbi:MAG: hypothetical protein WA366_12285 [Pseudolabrys sp.]